MALTQFDDQNKDELSMIEVARAILSDRHETMGFNDLLNEVQAFTGKSDEEIRTRLSQFYTDLNIDGSFISLGDTMWGLRSWYPIDSIDEAVHLDLEEEVEGKPKKKKKRKKINAFLADADDDDDVIDYNDDDPEDDDFDVADTDDDDSTDDDDDDDKKDTDGDFNHDEVSGGLGDEISGIKTNVDDDYGSGDIEH